MQVRGGERTRRGEQDEEADKQNQRCRQAPRAACCTILLLLLLLLHLFASLTPHLVGGLREGAAGALTTAVMSTG